ncbi:MAG: cytochrome P450 [Balneola sp.]|nr:MAG: cytochrome P450 [Balneola sp.]
MKASEFSCPFEHLRKEDGVYQIEDHGESVHMVLRLKDLRKAAHSWEIFNSGSVDPGRIVIPSEVDVRDIRQIPVEMDPPQHKDFRALLDPWFKRPLEEGFQQKLDVIIDELLNEACSGEEIELVEEFSLKLQSRALTLLLNTAMDEADTWISWGTHVFRGEGGELDSTKAGVVDEYILQKIEEASTSPGEDLFSVLLNSEVEGRKLSKEEVHGIMNLTFAGGRDTVINTLTNSIAYFAEHPEALQQIRENPDMVNNAVEELVRYFSPLTQLGRVAAEESMIGDCPIKKNEKIGLTWASANRDESVFENPEEVILDRKRNPHVAFGFGIHACLGATHARQILRKVVKALSERVDSIDIINFKENIESIGEIKRKVGFEEINVRFNSK